MFNADVPMTTDQPIIQTRNNDNVPAYKIIDNTSGASSPIVINKTDGVPSPQPNVDSGGNYSCCGSSSQNQQPKPPQDPSQQPTPPPLPVTPAPPPTRDPNTPYKQFVGQVTIVIHQGDPDIYGFNGQEPTFTATGCFPYKPPTIPAPADPFDERFNAPNGTVQQQIDNFKNRWELDGYEVISKTVTGPGASC